MCPPSVSCCANRNREREVYWFASLTLGDRYFEVVETGYKFRWSLRLGPAALKELSAAQPASVSSEDLALVLPVEPSWHKRPFYFGPDLCQILILLKSVTKHPLTTIGPGHIQWNPRGRGEENYISCARSDTEHFHNSLNRFSKRKPGEGHSHLRFVKLRGMKCTNSVLSLHF